MRLKSIFLYGTMVLLSFARKLVCEVQIWLPYHLLNSTSISTMRSLLIIQVLATLVLTLSSLCSIQHHGSPPYVNVINSIRSR